MIEAAKGAMLALLKVPSRPHLPAGGAGTARVFRAARPYLWLKLLNWGGSQLMTLIGLVAALFFLDAAASGRLDILNDVPHRAIILRFLGWAEVVGIVGYVIQLPLSVLPVVLDWELRWYMVTDRSLRIREGVWKVSELTMTFANVQEVSIHQGPLERLLGIANLRVRTAGGGQAISSEGKDEEKSGHIGYFRGVDDAPGIRDLILERLRRLRDAGLGDPDQPEDEAPATGSATASDVRAAAEELLGEARGLRRAVGL